MVGEKSALAGRQRGETRCPRCGAAFVCGMVAGEATCWCACLPALGAPPDPAMGCLCSDCLRAALAANGAADPK